MGQPAIGQLLHPEWNEAKELGDEDVAYNCDGVRVEAVGADWIITRRVDNGKVLAATFDSPEQFENFLDNMEAPSHGPN